MPALTEGGRIMEQSGLFLLSAFLLSAVSVRDFGVIGDGEALNTDAIQKLIDKFELTV